MKIAAEQPGCKAPATYQEWLSCLEQMKGRNGREAFAAAAHGSFAGSELTLGALQKQIVETVNALLDQSVKRFLRRLNESIAFNELAQTELLFKRLRKSVHEILFFEELAFLPEAFRASLSEAVKTQMGAFWNKTVRFLEEQSLEFSNSQLEDALFLIRRIRLFE